MDDFDNFVRQLNMDHLSEIDDSDELWNVFNDWFTNGSFSDDGVSGESTYNVLSDIGTFDNQNVVPRTDSDSVNDYNINPRLSSITYTNLPIKPLHVETSDSSTINLIQFSSNFENETIPRTQMTNAAQQTNLNKSSIILNNIPETPSSIECGLRRMQSTGPSRDSQQEFSFTKNESQDRLDKCDLDISFINSRGNKKSDHELREEFYRKQFRKLTGGKATPAFYPSRSVHDESFVWRPQVNKKYGIKIPIYRQLNGRLDSENDGRFRKRTTIDTKLISLPTNNLSNDKWFN